jgi:hypothetical protein
MRIRGAGVRRDTLNHAQAVHSSVLLAPLAQSRSWNDLCVSGARRAGDAAGGRPSLRSKGDV